MSVHDLDMRALIDDKGGPCHDVTEREEGSHRVSIGWFRPPAVSVSDEEFDALIEGRRETLSMFRDAKPEPPAREIASAAHPADWAFVRMYVVPQYDTSPFAPHHKYGAYAEEDVRNIMAGYGLAPGMPRHLARLVKAHRAGQLPLPFAMEIAEIGGRVRCGVRRYWLSWQTDSKQSRPLMPRTEGKVNDHLGLPGFFWSTVYLGIPSSEFA